MLSGEAIRAKQLMDQVMKTWNPPLLAGDEQKADIAQTSVMLTIAYIMGPEFMPSSLNDNQKDAINSGMEFYKQFFGE